MLNMRIKALTFSLNLKNGKSPNYEVLKRNSGTMITRPMEGKYAVGNLGINVLRTGTGHNVFCLPGALGTIWTDFAPQIEGFNLNKYSLNIWDPPGYGNSRPPNREFSPRFYERDALWAAKLMRKLDIAPCALLGWSDGGITAMIIAAKYPQLVSKLVIWGANAYVTLYDIKLYEGIRDISKWSPKMRNSLSSIYGEEHLQSLMNQWVETMIYIQDRMKGEICTDLIARIKAPTLILHGEKDPLVPRTHVHYLYSRIPVASVHFFPEGKHNIHIKHAKEFNEVVQKFLYGL